MLFGRFNNILCQTGVLKPQGKREIWESKPQPKHAIANCGQTVSPMPPPGEYKRREWFRLLSNYFGPCYMRLYCIVQLCDGKILATILFHLMARTEWAKWIEAKIKLPETTFQFSLFCSRCTRRLNTRQLNDRCKSCNRRQAAVNVVTLTRLT